MCHFQIYSQLSCLSYAFWKCWSISKHWVYFLLSFDPPPLNLHLPLGIEILYHKKSVIGRVSSTIIKRKTKYIGNAVAVKDESVHRAIQIVCSVQKYNPLSPRVFAYTVYMTFFFLLQTGLIVVMSHILSSWLHNLVLHF